MNFHWDPKSFENQDPLKVGPGKNAIQYVNRKEKWFSQRTSEAHECALSGLLPQSFHILIVDVNKVDRLETERFGGDHHFLPSVQEFFSVFSACGS